MKQLAIGVLIGASLSGTYQTAFGSAKKTLNQLGAAAKEARKHHDELGKAIAVGMHRADFGVGAVRAQYQKLGEAIKRAKDRQAELGAAMQRHQALAARGAGLRQSFIGQAATAAAIGAPVAFSMKKAVAFQDTISDIAITGEFTRAQEAALGQTVRRNALQFNQTTEAIAGGLGVLVAGGIQNAKELERYSPVLAKAATATRASFEDLGNVLLAGANNLRISAADSEAAINILAKAGKLGQFEIRDMARWLPAIAPGFQALGIEGPKAVAQIGAALQIARKGAGTNEAAANNFINFLGHLTSPDTMKDFKNAGIDLHGTLRNLAVKGLNPVEGMLRTILGYVEKKGGKGAVTKLRKTLSIEDAAERERQVSGLAESFKLGELFQDRQVLDFIRVALANRKELAEIEKTALAAGGQDVIGADFARRAENAKSQVERLGIVMDELKLTVGEPLLKPFTEGLIGIMPKLQSLAGWVSGHPGLLKGLIGGAGGLLAMRLAATGVLILGNSFKVAGAAIGVLRSGMRALGALSALRALMPGARAMGFLARGAAWLGKVLGGVFLIGLRAAGRALLILGRALLLNPIGLAVTAIGVAAFLVHKHWNTVKSALLSAWSWLQSMGARFYQAGADLIHGLVNGIQSAWVTARDAVIGIGQSIKSTFTGVLGIHSPSRVFAGYGAQIAIGAGLGIARAESVPRQAARRLGMRSFEAANAPVMGRPVGRAGANNVINITYSPNIALNGAESGQARGAIQEVNRMSVRELESMLRRVMAARERRAY